MPTAKELQLLKQLQQLQESVVVHEFYSRPDGVVINGNERLAINAKKMGLIPCEKPEPKIIVPVKSEAEIRKEIEDEMYAKARADIEAEAAVKAEAKARAEAKAEAEIKAKAGANKPATQKTSAQ